MLQNVTAGKGIESMSCCFGWKATITGLALYRFHTSLIKYVEATNPSLKAVTQKILKNGKITVSLLTKLKI